MQALEQMWISLQTEHRVVVGVPHHLQGLNLREGTIVLYRAGQHDFTMRIECDHLYEPRQFCLGLLPDSFVHFRVEFTYPRREELHCRWCNNPTIICLDWRV
jgi:hypothetical protein